MVRLVYPPAMRRRPLAPGAERRPDGSYQVRLPNPVFKPGRQTRPRTFARKAPRTVLGHFPKRTSILKPDGRQVVKESVHYIQRNVAPEAHPVGP